MTTKPRMGTYSPRSGRNNLFMRLLIERWWSANLYTQNDVRVVLEDAKFSEVRFGHFPFRQRALDLWGHVISAEIRRAEELARSPLLNERDLACGVGIALVEELQGPLRPANHLPPFRSPHSRPFAPSPHNDRPRRSRPTDNGGRSQPDIPLFRFDREGIQ